MKAGNRPDRGKTLCNRYAWACAAVLVIGVGCGGRDVVPAASGAPPPGTVVTVSVTPIEVAQPPNLIQNGEFSAWQAGTSAPDFFGAPDSARGMSVIEPELDGDGRVHAVRQTWKKSDSLAAYSHLFHTWVTNLKPDTRYRFSLHVRNESTNAILVRAFQYPVRTPAEALASDAAPEVLGSLSFAHTEGFEEFDFEFQTSSVPEFCVLIGVKTNVAEGTFPAVCVWDDWTLRPVTTPQASVQ